MKSKTIWFACALALAFLVVSCVSASPNGMSVIAISDKQGGAIALYKSGKRIYAQRVTTSGQLNWNTSGILLNERFTPSSLYWQKQINLIEDGNGGAIATWDDRSGFVNNQNDPAFFSSMPVFSQRLKSDGTKIWSNPVLTGNTQEFGDYLTTPIADGSGGGFFVYDDFQVAYKALHNDFFYLQKLDSAGVPQWGTKGILIASTNPFHPTTAEEKSRGEQGAYSRSGPSYEGFSIAYDMAGGVFAVWLERKSAVDETVYAQHFDPDGKPLWNSAGIPVYKGPISISSVVIDGSGGVFITLCANQYSSSGTLTVQRIDAKGDLPWTQNGTTIKGYVPNLGFVSAFSGGNTDLIVIWQQPGGINRADTLSALRLDSSGRTVWQKDPITVTDPGDTITDLSNCTDDTSVFLSWRTSQYSSHGLSGGSIIAQRLDKASGQLLWKNPGIRVFNDPELRFQSKPQIVTDNGGGCVVLAVIGKNMSSGDSLNGQRLDANGDALWSTGIKVSR